MVWVIVGVGEICLLAFGWAIVFVGGRADDDLDELDGAGRGD